jgi:hypothetical protein
MSDVIGKRDEFTEYHWFAKENSPYRMDPDADGSTFSHSIVSDSHDGESLEVSWLMDRVAYNFFQ